MGAGRTLADDLAELINPMPKDYDPEAQDGTAAHTLQHEDHQLQALTKDVYDRPKGGKLPMRAGIAIDSHEYRGKKTTRQQVFDEDEFEQDEMQAADIDNSEQDDVEDDEDEQNELQGIKRVAAKQANNKSASGISDDFDDDDEDDDGSDESPMSDSELDGDLSDQDDEDEDVSLRKAVMPVDDEEIAELEEGYKQLQAAESQAVAALQEKGRRDVEKGRAARNQQVLYERVLEMRILLQKALVGSNRLPLPQDTSAILTYSETQPETGRKRPLSEAESETLSSLQQKLTDFSKAAHSTLQELMTLHDTLITGPQCLASESVAPPNEPAQPPNNSEAYWNAMKARYQSLSSFRDASLDRWHARAVLGSGSATLQGSLRALHQSISKQVANMLQDPHKLVTRSRVAISDGHRHLLQPQIQPPEDDADQETAMTNGYGAAVERDEETYDDGEFYQQLLKEFLEQSGAGGTLAVKPAKKRKVVDRRASKGRKIRYNVQEKLVNFMAPVVMEPPVFAEQLFANLFGHQ